MIQFNLLPDVKQEYIKAAKLKRTVIVSAFLTAASTLFIFVMLFLSVHIFQKVHLKALNDDIKTSSDTLKNTKDLEKVLTIQNQLDSLPKLHSQKPVASRLFGYLSQTTPTQLTIGKLDIDFDKKVLVLDGTADSLGTVNKFVDTLKFTTFGVKDEDGKLEESKTKPFTGVVLTSFARNEKGTTYKITLSFAPDIFDTNKDVALIVPKIISTRSETEKPTELFNELPEMKPL